MMWIVYLIGILNSFKILACLCIVAFVICLIVSMMHAEDDSKNAGKSIKKFFISLICSIFFAIILPSKETSITMAAVYVGEKVITSETVTNLTETSIDYLQTWIANEKEKIENRK